MVPPEEVVPQLEQEPALLCRYLHAVFQLGLLPRRYADTLLALYADHDRDSLLPFLRQCTAYSLPRCAHARAAAMMGPAVWALRASE